MKMLFIGGDKRQLEIIRNMHAKRHQIDTVGYGKNGLPIGVINRSISGLQMGNYDAIFFPVSGVCEDYSIVTEFNEEKVYLPKYLLVKTKESALIFTGIRNKGLNDMLSIANRNVIALMEDRTVTIENSIPTIEGIIGDLINNTDHTINDSNILVFGYGNVGKPLVDKLRYLGARVTVGVILESDYKYLNENGIKAIYTTDKESMKESLRANDTIINTVPSIILDKESIRYIDGSVYILDIASHPHGIDIKAANEQGIRAKIWLGIPSVVAPRTAAMILYKKINSYIGGNKNE